MRKKFQPEFSFFYLNKKLLMTKGMRLQGFFIQKVLFYILWHQGDPEMKN